MQNQTGVENYEIAIVTDSNSGITQKQAQELGVFVLAMPFQIDGETYYGGHYADTGRILRKVKK